MKVENFFRGAYLHGEFLKSSTGKEWQNLNPYRLNEIFFQWYEDEHLVDAAVDHAEKAFAKWKQTDIGERVQLLNRLAELFQKNETEIGNLISLETGKAIWEALAEAKALSSKIRISIDLTLPMMQSIERTGFQEKKQYMKWLPRGVCAVLGPFNFPLHLANGHIVPALLAGNTVIYKGSEHAPACSSFYSALIHEAGFPPSVFQSLPGGGATGKRLVEHPKVKGIFFTGSYANGLGITKALLQTRGDLDSLAALEMGGKNATIVHKDADFKKAVSETWMSAYATAGQRCSCTSRVFIHESLYQNFKEAFLKGLKNIKAGDPQAPETFMGPMIHPQAVNSYFSKIEIAQKEGLKPLIDSSRPDSNSCVVTPSVYESLNPSKDTQTESLKEELFGPHCVLIPYSQLEEMLEWHERAPYGLVTSLFTASEEIIERVDSQIEVGLLNLNRGTVGASSQLPFGGKKKSGNNWPAGLFSYFYCATPRSYLRDDSKFDSSKLPTSLRDLANFLESEVS